ncbi:MAG TPA: YceI family protein [Bacteroidales bacterium]|nr:YceI family protein [Bacteroidales bacterium]HRX97792.1 YceI family protein [Bacteroidales bacterium]
MKTNKLVLSLAIAGVVFLASCSNSSQKQTEQSADQTMDATQIENVEINLDDSRVAWKGEMLGVYSHTGTVGLTNSEINFSEGKISGGNFTVDLTSMIPTDNNYNPEEGSTPEKLVGHLSSPDFFDVENYPTATFEILSVDGNTAYGNLTVRGKTHEEKVENIEIKEDGDQVQITGELVFDRKKYDVSWDSPIKDRILSSDIEINVALAGKKS